MKLKDNKGCQCHDVARDSDDHKFCRFGYCVMVLCIKCRLPWCEWGPIECPHKKNENGTLRWYKYPDMDKKTHVATKENKTMRKPKRFVRKP